MRHCHPHPQSQLGMDTVVGVSDSLKWLQDEDEGADSPELERAVRIGFLLDCRSVSLPGTRDDDDVDPAL